MFRIDVWVWIGAIFIVVLGPGSPPGVTNYKMVPGVTKYKTIHGHEGTLGEEEDAHGLRGLAWMVDVGEKLMSWCL